MNNIIKHSASIFATAFVLVFIGAAVANAGPCGAPGTCNTPAPLNVGLNQQTKLGSLFLNGSTTPLSTALYVMFGTSTFNGHVQITDGTQGAGKILTSDANGVASWKTSTSTLTGSSTIIYNYKTTCRASMPQTDAGWNDHDWVASECDNGLPVTGCIGAMSSTRTQSDDTHMALLSPGETGPKSGTSMDNAVNKTYTNGGFAAYRTGSITTTSASTVGRYFCPTAVSSVATGEGSSVSGTTNYVSKFTNASTIGNSQIFDNGTNIGIGTTNPGSKLQVHGPVRIIKEGAVTPGIPFFGADSYSSTEAGASASVDLRRARNTLTAPEAVQSGDRLGGIVAAGWDGSSFYGASGNAAGIQFYATENYTTAAHGASIQLETTPNGTITRAIRLKILANGNVGIGTDSPDTKLEVAGQVKITGGSPGAGKVLTSDATGLATWQNVSTTAVAGMVCGGYYYNEGNPSSSAPWGCATTANLNTSTQGLCSSGTKRIIDTDLHANTWNVQSFLCVY